MSLFRLIDQTEVRAPAHAPEPREGAAEASLDAALRRPYRLPSFARNYTFHHGEPRLLRALRPLQGKFSVVNPTVVLALPPLAQDRVRALLGRTSEAHLQSLEAPAPATLATAAAPRALALHEPLRPVVQHETRSAGPSTMPARDIFFWAELRYRLTLAADPHVAANTELAAAAPLAGEPIQWFHVALLVPDADALRQMGPTTAHFYRHVTGRLGAGSTDCYWYLDTWERFHEEGQVIGCLSPSLVEHGHVAGAADARARALRPRAPTEEDVLFGDLTAFVPTHFEPYTPHFDRRGFVPPSYCLIHYFATVEIAVTHRAHRGVAA